MSSDESNPPSPNPAQPLAYVGSYPIYPSSGLDEEQQHIERELAVRLSDTATSDAAYTHEPSTEGGRIISTDLYRELCPQFAAAHVRGEVRRQQRTRCTRATYNPAKTAANERFIRLLATLPHDSLVLFMAAMMNVGRAIDHGHRASVILVATPFERALRNMIDRARVDGRYLTLDAMAKSHFGAWKNFLRMRTGPLGAQPRVEFGVIDC